MWSRKENNTTSQIFRGKGLYLKLPLLFGFMLALAITAFAAHDTTVDISPEITTCGIDPVDYTLIITNNGDSSDNIREIRIYDDVDFDGQRDPGIVSFECGDAPTGWNKFDELALNNYCRYTTGSLNRINPGASETFSFKAKLDDSSLQACGNTFKVASIDDKIPVGEVVTKFPTVAVDCQAPIVQKMVGNPNIAIDSCVQQVSFQGTDNAACDYNITQETDISVWAHDNNTLDGEILRSVGERCDVGIDYCQWRYTLDNVTSEWFEHENGGSIHFDFSLPEDSEHFIEIECFDLAGNKTTVTETDFVETVPPVTKKEFTGPQKFEEGPDGTIEWIDGITTIDLFMIDPAPHPSGVYNTYFKNYLDQSEEACWEPDNFCEPSGCSLSAESFCGEALWSGVDEYLSCLDSYLVVECGFNVYQGTIAKDEESCHVLEFLSIDNLGNIENTNTNCFFVDKTPPFLEKFVGEPSIEDFSPEFPLTDEFFHWVTPETPIEFFCDDQEPHPAGGEELLLKVSYDLADDGFVTEEYCSKYSGTMEEDWCVIDMSNSSFVFNFNENEDSVHDLEYFCRDAVGKQTEIRLQYYKVDSTPPSLTKEMFGDFLGDCPTGGILEHGDCYVADNGSSGVSITPEDGGAICAVSNLKCFTEVWWESTGEECTDAGEFPYKDGFCRVYAAFFNEFDTLDIAFTEDSTHKVITTCSDALGNEVIDEEIFLVDSTPPETTKEYGEPFFSFEGAEWITSSTSVTLTAEDEKVGVDATFWRNTIVLDQYCWVPEEFCVPCEFTENGQCDDFQEYTGPFFKGEQSCHLIEFFSVDLLGNEEEIQRQCTFVDNTPPEGLKEIGEPHVIKESEEFVSQETEFFLSCTDPEPHPVDFEQVCFSVSLEDNGFEDITEQYCEPNEEGFCCFEAPVEFLFEEDSKHNLEFFCEDALGNRNEADLEFFTVETVPPETTKQYLGPFFSKEVCFEEYNNECAIQEFIDTETLVELTAVDPEPHPVGVDQTFWRTNIVPDLYCKHPEIYCQPCELTEPDCGVFSPYVSPFPIEEESCHVIEFFSVDELGNEERLNFQCAFVDHTPPETEKEYGDPFFSDGDMDWITSVTDIFLFATDSFGPHDSGIKSTSFRVTLVDDQFCELQDELFDCENAQGDGNFVDYTGDPFQIPEESCHLIEFFSVDNVDKVEEVNKQCVFVDNTGPEPVKTVGEPSSEWTPGQNGDANSMFYPEIEDLCWNGEEDQLECWKVTLLTPITLECSDPEPHPVDHESIFFMVDLDGEDATEFYCDKFNADFNMNGNGWCFADQRSEEFFFLEETEHNLKFYCEDALGNAGPVDDEKFKVEGTAFEIQLNKKWNLISVPFVLINDDPEAVFESVSENVESVWTYDAFLEEWFVFRPADPGASNLESIIPGNGYWLSAFEEDVLILGGSLFSPKTTPPDKPILNGVWNLIGYFGNFGVEEDVIMSFEGPNLDGDGKPAYCALSSLLEDVFDLPFHSLITYWEQDNPDQYKFLDFEDFMNPGAGYWMHSNRDGSYVFTTTCSLI